MTRRIITSAVLIVLLVALGMAGFKQLAALRKESARTEQALAPPLVRAQRAEVQDYREILRGYGRALPLRRTQVVAEVAGIVREISPLLESGAAIESRTGDGAALPVLVRLDDRDLRDMVAGAEAELAVADAEISRTRTNAKSLTERLAVAEEDVETATRELRRIAGLVPETLTQSDLDAQRIQVSMRRNQKLVIEALIAENADALVSARAARLARARALDLARRQLERADVRAPYAGRIVSRQVNLGASVRVGDPLFTIVDLTQMEVPVALPARRFDEVRPGAKATARLPGAPETIWEGAVRRVAPAINADDRTFFAYVVIDGSPADTVAPPGAHLLVEVAGRVHPHVIAVPRRAFLGDQVFVARPLDGGREAVVEVRTPTVSRLLPAAGLVTAGIEDGEMVLLTNLESVAEGSRVRLAPAADDATGAPDAPTGPPAKEQAPK